MASAVLSVIVWQIWILLVDIYKWASNKHIYITSEAEDTNSEDIMIMKYMGDSDEKE